MACSDPLPPFPLALLQGLHFGWVQPRRQGLLVPAAPSLGLQLHPDGAGHRHSLNLPSKLYVAKVLLPVSMAERAEAPLPSPAFHSGTEEEALPWTQANDPGAPTAPFPSCLQDRVFKLGLVCSLAQVRLLLPAWSSTALTEGPDFIWDKAEEWFMTNNTVENNGSVVSKQLRNSW